MEVEFLELLHEANLGIILEELLHLLQHVGRRHGIVVEVVVEHIEVFEQFGAVESLAHGESIGFVALEGLDNGLQHIERVLILDIAVADEATVHESIDIGGITECANVLMSR